MNLNFKNQRNNPDLMSTLSALVETIQYNKINCCRIGIIEEYNSNTRVAKVTIANKLVLGLDEVGNQITSNYAPIYAKVVFLGWGDIGITHPVVDGMEGLLLFCDREIESWFVNGNINNLAYKRAHSKTDAVFIPGLLSLPNMIATLTDCLNLFYKNTYLRLKENEILINGNTNLTGNFTSSGTITGTSLIDTNAATGSFTSSEGKTITVQNGIIKSIS